MRRDPRLVKVDREVTKAREEQVLAGRAFDLARDRWSRALAYMKKVLERRAAVLRLIRGKRKEPKR